MGKTLLTLCGALAASGLATASMAQPPAKEKGSKDKGAKENSEDNGYGKMPPVRGLLGSGKTVDPRPNILLLFVDDMGFRDTGYTGSDFYETPVIDSLARISMRFNYGYACAGNSAPSRACLISGAYGPRHGVYAVSSTERGPKEQMRLRPYPNNENLPLGIYTVADAMKAAGYNTSQVGKWHLGVDREHAPDRFGFMYSMPAKPPSDERFRSTGDPKDMFEEIRLTIDFIEQSVQNKAPFFAYIPFHAVHQKWQAQQESIAYFANKKPGVQHTEVLYAAMIRDLDRAIGAVLAKLRELGVGDNTLVVFTSDNGGIPATSQAPLRGFKGCLYEGGIRVPFFIHYPKEVKAGESDVPVQNVDLYPTFVDYAGFKVPGGKILDGESLRPILAGKSDKLSRKALFWHFPGYLNGPCPGGRDKVFRQRPSTVILKGEWKLTLFYEEWMLDGGREKIDTNNSVELYNIVRDVSERDNVASSQKAKRDELLDDLLAWLKTTGAHLPTLR